MKYNFLLFIAILCILFPLSTHAADFIGLVGIPGIETNGSTDLNAYINALYRLSISIAALLAVIKIVIAGAKYMLTDIVPAKEDAKKDIQGALIGLLIVIGAIIILNTVNSDLTNLDLSITPSSVEQSPTIQDVIAQRIEALNNAQSSCTTSKEDFEECVIVDNISSDFCTAKNGIFVRGSISNYVTGVGTCTYKQITEIPNTNIINCSCNDRRTGWAEDGSWSFNILNCYGYSCTDAISTCTGAGYTVISENNNSGQILCSQPTNDREVTPIEQVTPLPTNVVTNIRNNLTGLSQELQNSIIQRAQSNIGDNLLTANVNTLIQNEQDATSVVLSASLPTNISPDRRALIENTISGVCSDVISNTNYREAGVVTGSLANGTSYIACVR